MIMDWLRSRNRSRNEKVYTERYRVACVGILFLIMEMLGRTAERRFEFLNNITTPSRAMTVAVFFVISSHPPASLKWRKKRIIRENFPMLAATRPRRKDIPEADLHQPGGFRLPNGNMLNRQPLKRRCTGQRDLQQAFYNLEHAISLGQPTENKFATNHQMWQRHQAYQGALKLKKDDADARFNYEL